MEVLSYIIVGLIAVFSALSLLITYQKYALSNARVKHWAKMEVVYCYVEAAEMLFGRECGRQKLAYVRERLSKLGFEDDDKTDAMIESCVYKMKQSQSKSIPNATDRVIESEQKAKEAEKMLKSSKKNVSTTKTQAKTTTTKIKTQPKPIVPPVIEPLSDEFLNPNEPATTVSKARPVIKANPKPKKSSTKK